MVNSSSNNLLGNGSLLSGRLLREHGGLEIRSILGLPDVPESGMIGRMALINGISGLSVYEESYPQIKSKHRELREYLEKHFDQEWQTDEKPWFRNFVTKQKQISPQLYADVLTLTAKDRKYITEKDMHLFIVLRLFFKFNEGTGITFNQIWNDIVNRGFPTIKNYRDHLAAEENQGLFDEEDNPVSEALYRLTEKTLNKAIPKQSEWNNREADIAQAAREIVQHGWINGLEQTKLKTELLSPEAFNALCEMSPCYGDTAPLPPPPSMPIVPSSAEPTTSTATERLNLFQYDAVLSREPSTSTPERSESYRYRADPPPVSPSTESTTTTAERSTSFYHWANPSPFSPVAQTLQELDHATANSPEGRLIDQFRRQQKLQLVDLVHAGELMYIGHSFQQVLTDIVQRYDANTQIPSLINETFIPLMYFLKRHQNLDSFYELFYSIFHKQSPVNGSIFIPTLKMLIDLLLCRSDLSLSHKLLSLLSKRNPVPFLEPSMRFVPDILHVWDYSIPILLSFGISPRSGKSQLLNRIFASSFQLSPSPDHVYFTNTIDVDFGYNFLQRRPLNIADAHGSMKKDLLERIHRLFDGYLIHVQYEYLKENRQNIYDLLNVINAREKYRLLIVRDVSNGEESACTEFLAANFQNLDTTILMNARDAQNRFVTSAVKHLTEKIVKDAPKQPFKDRTFLSKTLLDLLGPEYKQQTEEITRIIEPLKEHLRDVVRNPRLTSTYFSEYLQYAKLCAATLKLARKNFYGDGTDEEIYQLRQEIFELKKTTLARHPREQTIYRSFLLVLQAPNMLTCLDALHAELREERERVVSVADLAMELPIEKNLTLEVLWRNAIVCSSYQTQPEQAFLQEKYFEYIQAGYPFEIVDGDNFSFPYEFLSAALTPLQDRRIFVVSVIGPQNSGKSTLLNYMFGTLFDVRDGRCSRGIYGSLIRSNRNDFDDILLLDTEGLLSVERTDAEYDRRIVLFCLAVSHVVLVNVAREMNTAVQNMLELCRDLLSKMGTTRTTQAELHVILNQTVNLELNHNLTAIRETLQIGEGRFHTLPAAFQTDQWRANQQPVQTAPDFLPLVLTLTKNVLDSIRNVQPVNALKWLSSSYNIFDALSKSADLTYYRDIHERNTDYQIRDRIQQRLSEIFTIEYRENITRRTLDRGDQEVQKIFQDEQDRIERETQRDLEQLFNLLRVPEPMRQRNRQFLRVQIYAMFNALRTSTSEKHRREKVMNFFHQAEGQMRQMIDNNIRQGGLLSIHAAEQQFDKLYQEKIAWIRERFDEKRLFEQGMVHIYTNYQIYEKGSLVDNHSFKQHCSELPFFIDRAQSIDDLQRSIIQYFTHIAYQLRSPVSTNNFNPSEDSIYSLSMINGVHHLNRRLLENQYQSFVSRANAASTEGFQVSVREAIKTEQPLPLDNSRFDETRMYFGLTTIFQTLVQRVLEAMGWQDVRSPIRQVQTELIQRINGLVASLILDVNDELNPFCLELSPKLKYILHTAAMAILSKYHFDEQMNHFNQLLKEFQTNQDELKHFYVNTVNENRSQDNASASSLIRSLKDHLAKSLLHDAQEIVRRDLRNNEEINRKFIQDRIDGQLTMRNDVQWYIDYVDDPTKIIEQFFIQIWNDIKRGIDQKLTGRKRMYGKVIEEFLFCIQGMVDHLRRLGVSNQLIDQLFQADHRSTEDYTEKCRCMVELIYLYFVEQRIIWSHQVNNNRYQVTEPAQRAFEALLNERRPSQELAQIIQAMGPIVQNLSIGNINTFLESTMNRQDKLRHHIEDLRCDLDSVDQDDTYARILDKVRGCLQLCPCCRRPCDVDHTQTKSQLGSPDNQHRCQTGHNLRAMNGYKIEVTNEPSLFMCEQIKDDQVLVINSRRYLWSNFKKYHAAWNFDSTLNDYELRLLHSKFLMVWRKVGPTICCRYRMQFVGDNQTLEIRHQSSHYVLLLDGSGSMAGQPWQHLLRAVQEFLTRRRALNVDDRITIIVFSNKTYRVIEDEDIQHVDIDRIAYPGGGTSFIRAFDDVYQCIQCYSKRAPLNPAHKRFVIVFMSDGEAEYPELELKRLLKDYHSIIQRFWTITLASDSSPAATVLKRINATMSGSFMDVKTSVDLIKVYAEVASE